MTITISRAALNDIIEALTQAQEYFDARMDVDCDEVGFIPNKEATLLVLCDEALAALPKVDA